MSIDLGARALGDAHAPPLLGAARPHARRLALPRIQQRHVGDVDRTLALDHADLRVRAARVRALVALDHVDALDVDALARSVDADDLARLALVLARDHDDLVVGAQLHGSEHLRGERDDLHESAVAQLARDRPEDARAARVVLGVDDHGGVLVERDVRAVVAPELLLRAHDDRLDDLALLDRPLRVGLLHGRRDDVPHARVAAAGAAHHADAEDLTRAGVVGHAQPGLVLDHRARSTTSISRQRLLRDIGRHSWTRTVSPAPASLRSSWACSLIEVRMILW